MARALFLVLLLAGLAGCAYHCNHQRWEQHSDNCYFPGAGSTWRGGGGDGLSGSWNQYYAPGGCDGLAYQGGKERCDRD